MRSEDTRLVEPVTITIENRRVVGCYGGNRVFVDFLNSCFEDIENFRNVGELGFGTNWGIDAPIALNSHINERVPGVHLGFGDHNQNQAVAGYACPVHIDLIARGGRIWFDDDPVPLDLQAIVPSSRPHPTRFRDDDLRTSGETVEEEIDRSILLS
jgi:leucyl aminopeptidase (aminopeptidase T)